VAEPFYAIVDPDERTIATFPGLTRKASEFVSFLNSAKGGARTARRDTNRLAPRSVRALMTSSVTPTYFGNGASAGLAPAASGERAVFMIMDR